MVGRHWAWCSFRMARRAPPVTWTVWESQLPECVGGQLISHNNRTTRATQWWVSETEWNPYRACSTNDQYFSNTWRKHLAPQSWAINPRKPKIENNRGKDWWKWVNGWRYPSTHLVFIGNGVGHRDMGRVQRLGAVGGRRAEVAVGLGRPTPSQVRLPPDFYSGSLTVMWWPA
jgi:hypothetical protein